MRLLPLAMSLLYPQTNKQTIKARIDAFFGDGSPGGTVLFFYKAGETVSELVEERLAEDDAAEREVKGEVKNDAAPADEVGAEAAAPAKVAPAMVAPTTVEVKVMRCFLAEADLMEVENMESPASMYFVKINDGSISATKVLESIDYGVLCGKTLLNLHDVFREIYTPALVAPTSGSVTDSPDDVEDVGSDPSLGGMHDHGMQKFSTQLTQTLQQVDGDLQLSIPDVSIVDVGVSAEDFELVNQLESALEEWSKVIASVVEHEQCKQVQGDGPLAEIEFWRERNAALSSLYEQIRMPHVQQMVKVLGVVEANMLPTFQYHFSELTKLCVEAKDNVKFLTTLERHFKNIGTGNLSSIQETLPSMMNAIRMVSCVCGSRIATRLCCQKVRGEL